MAEEKKVQGQFGVDVLVSFLAGAAIGVGLILFAESKSKSDDDSAYGEADLFV